MHFHAEIWVKNKPKSLQEAQGIVKSIGHLGDWNQIGGRWMGEHDNYKPENNPANYEVCNICKGTGTRDWDKTDDQWAKDCHGCNSCHGTGVSQKWPTEWKPYEGDILELSKVRDNLSCYTVVIHKGRLNSFFHSEDWTGSAFVKGAMEGKTVKEFLKSKGITDGYLITVDYHE